MMLSMEEYLNLSIDGKIKYLKDNGVTIHPYLWMLLKDGLINSVNTVYWAARDKNEADPPQAIPPENAKKIIERCEQFNVNLEKIQNGLLPSTED